jgi:hypothetical protein
VEHSLFWTLRFGFLPEECSVRLLGAVTRNHWDFVAVLAERI